MHSLVTYIISLQEAGAFATEGVKVTHEPCLKGNRFQPVLNLA